MGRPRLSGSERSARQKVGGVLRLLREGQQLSLDEVCRFLNDNVPRARLWGIEKGILPYSGLLVRLASLYSKSPESIIEQATGQSSLNLLGSFLLLPSSPESTRRRVFILMTSEEEELVKSYLDWLRYRRVMGVRVD